MAAVWVYGIIGEIDHWWFQMHFLLRTTVLFLLCFFVHVMVSLLTAAPPIEKIESLTWSSKLIADETAELAGLPWWQNYRYHSIALLILSALVVGYFW